MHHKILKRIFDFLFSFIFLIFLIPIIIFFSILIFFTDYNNPLFFSKRVGINNKSFNLIKLRTMKKSSEYNFLSTSNNDPRLTGIGIFIRNYKIDELPQFFNVLFGSMSIVGPRPQVKIDTDKYTDKEKSLLLVKPGITDFSSIIFSDEAKILDNSDNPDNEYNIVIRPYKSRLGLFYIDNQSLNLDIYLIFCTFFGIINREKILKSLSKKIKSKGGKQILINIAKRSEKIKIIDPPI